MSVISKDQRRVTAIKLKTDAEEHSDDEDYKQIVETMLSDLDQDDPKTQYIRRLPDQLAIFQRQKRFNRE